MSQLPSRNFYHRNSSATCNIPLSPWQRRGPAGKPTDVCLHKSPQVLGVPLTSVTTIIIEGASSRGAPCQPCRSCCHGVRQEPPNNPDQKHGKNTFSNNLKKPGQGIIKASCKTGLSWKPKENMRAALDVVCPPKSLRMGQLSPPPPAAAPCTHMQLASSYPTLMIPADRMFRNSWGWGKQAGVAAETLCSAFPLLLLPHTSPPPGVSHCSTHSKVNNHSSFLRTVLYRLQNMSTHLPTFAHPNLMWAGDTPRVAVRIYPSLLRSTPMLLGKIPF